MSSKNETAYRCVCCGTVLEDGAELCPKCKLPQLLNITQFVLTLATGDAKELIESYINECGRSDKAKTSKIIKLLENAQSWRHNKSYNEEYVKDVVKVLHFTDDGDVEIKNKLKMGVVEKTRMADAEKVYEYTREAASLGYLPALTTIGKCCLGGYGCKRQTLNAIALLCCAARAGDKEAYRLLVQGDEFYDEDFVKRIPDDIRGRSSYDDYYINNLTNVKFWEKRENPIEELESFAASNMLWAKYVLGDMYLRGNDFVEKDVEKGIALIRDAADRGPYNVQRAIKAKALLQFDKIVELNGQNNVDAAFSTLWRIRNLRVRREAEVEMLARTSIMECGAEKVNLNYDSRGAQLIWRAVKRFKDAHNASWITLPDGADACKKLSEGMYDNDYSYQGSSNSVIKEDGKRYYYRSPFLGKDGLFGTHGLIFSSNGLFGNLRSAERPNYKFEYTARYNYVVGGLEFSGLEEVDVWWLFRENECHKCNKGSRIYWVDWGLGGPVSFKPAGFTDIDLLTLIDFVRRSVFSDLRKGAKLIDGSAQKGQFSNKLELPMEASKHTLEIAKMIGGKASVAEVAPSPNGEKEHKKSESDETLPSQKKRWKFVTLGLLLGVFGLHFLYARRKGWFFFYWLMIIANVAQAKVPAVADAIGKTPYFGLIAGLTLVGSIFFMKKDGDGNRM